LETKLSVHGEEIIHMRYRHNIYNHYIIGKLFSKLDKMMQIEEISALYFVNSERNNTTHLIKVSAIEHGDLIDDHAFGRNPLL